MFNLSSIVNIKNTGLKSTVRNGEQIMKRIRSIKCGVILFLTATFLPLAVWASELLPHPETYLPKPDKMDKKLCDDPTDLFVARPYKDILPPEVYDKITFESNSRTKNPINS